METILSALEQAGGAPGDLVASKTFLTSVERSPEYTRAWLEALGDRIVPSTFHVTTLADGGAGSLRDAVARANALPGADTIDFQPALAGTIALTGGELDITDDVAIAGPGATSLTVSGSNTSRVFKIEPGKAVTISGLTIAQGNAVSGRGGGIDNSGALTVSDSAFSGNRALSGGALANEIGSTATVTGSTFRRNTAGSGNGGLNNEPGALLMQFDNRFLDDQAPDVFP